MDPLFEESNSSNNSQNFNSQNFQQNNERMVEEERRRNEMMQQQNRGGVNKEPEISKLNGKDTSLVKDTLASKDTSGNQKRKDSIKTGFKLCEDLC